MPGPSKSRVLFCFNGLHMGNNIGPTPRAIGEYLCATLDREEDGQWEGDDLNDQADDDNDDDLDVLDTKEDGHREGDYDEQDARVGE